ncbi:hypothetical protein KC367_g101 [Hortaea werneckii]|nr:hypothetical protein KC367_g101 [Hortaea werneckii]
MRPSRGTNHAKPRLPLRRHRRTAVIPGVASLHCTNKAITRGRKFNGYANNARAITVGGYDLNRLRVGVCHDDQCKDEDCDQILRFSRVIGQWQVICSHLSPNARPTFSATSENYVANLPLFVIRSITDLTVIRTREPTTSEWRTLFGNRSLRLLKHLVTSRTDHLPLACMRSRHLTPLLHVKWVVALTSHIVWGSKVGQLGQAIMARMIASWRVSRFYH